MVKLPVPLNESAKPRGIEGKATPEAKQPKAACGRGYLDPSTWTLLTSHPAGSLLGRGGTFPT